MDLISLFVEEKFKPKLTMFPKFKCSIPRDRKSFWTYIVSLKFKEILQHIK